MKNNKKIKLKKNVRYSICTCGASLKLPFCNNEHRQYNKINKSEYKSLKIISNKDVELDFQSKKWKDSCE